MPFVDVSKVIKVSINPPLSVSYDTVQVWVHMQVGESFLLQR